MGIFDFLKKPKTGSLPAGMELPPLPEMEGIGGFPELPKDSLPPLPEETLPPLPQMTATKPEQKPVLGPSMPKFDLPPIDDSALPPLPEMEDDNLGMDHVPMPPMPEPTKEMVYAKPIPKPEFPSLPISHDMIPNKIPPLEGVPEPPKGALQRIKPSELPKRPEIKQDAPKELPYVSRFSEEDERDTYASSRLQHMRRRIQGPLFVRTETVRQIVTHVEEIQIAFRGEDDIFFRITEIKNNEDKKYEKIRQSLEDMQRKLLFIDKTLFAA
jgi:hypothetical protein